MNQGHYSLSNVAFGLILLLSGRLITKGVTIPCTFGIECSKSAIKLMVQFPPNTSDSERFTVKHLKEQIIVDYTGKGTPETADPSRYSVTFRPVSVWITNASKSDTGTYDCEVPHLQFKSTCNLAEKQINDLKSCRAGGAKLSTSTSKTVSDSTSVNVTGQYSFNSSSDLSTSLTSDENPAKDNLIALGAAVGTIFLLLLLAVTAIFIWRKRLRQKNDSTSLHSAPSHTQTSKALLATKLEC